MVIFFAADSLNTTSHWNQQEYYSGALKSTQMQHIVEEKLHAVIGFRLEITSETPRVQPQHWEVAGSV